MYDPDTGFAVELPDAWEQSPGEASRPLSAGGYYQHRFSRRLMGSNQHTEKFRSLVVDTADGMPPGKHVVVLADYVEEDGEIRETDRIVTRQFDVDDRESDDAQHATEVEAHEFAHDLMTNY